MGELMYGERIKELEQRHTEVYKELLQTLDELYLAQLGNGTTLDREKRRTLEVRRQLQMSIEKSSVILRALKRLEQQKDSSADDADSSVTTEGILAKRLGDLMETNYKMDHAVSGMLSRQIELSKQLRSQRKTYDTLADQLKRLSSQLQAGRSAEDTKQEERNKSLVQQEESLEQESDTMEELLIALKVFGGYDCTT